jgi:hypothetical protein
MARMTGDLDIAIVGQLPPPKFALSDEFKPGPVKVEGFQAAFRCGGLRKQDLKHASGHANNAFILAQPDSELDGVSVGVPPGVGRKAKEHGPAECSANVLTNIPQTHPGVESLVLSVRSHRDLHIAVVNQLPLPSFPPCDNAVVLPPRPSTEA